MPGQSVGQSPVVREEHASQKTSLIPLLEIHEKPPWISLVWEEKTQDLCLTGWV